MNPALIPSINPSWPAVGLALIALLTVIVKTWTDAADRKRISSDLQEIKQRGNDNGKLLDGATRVNLVTIVTLSRRIAEGGAPADIEALKAAEQVVRDHDTRKAVANGVSAGLAQARLESTK